MREGRQGKGETGRGGRKVGGGGIFVEEAEGGALDGLKG